LTAAGAVAVGHPCANELDVLDRDFALGHHPDGLALGVRNCLFYDNENGILATPNAQSVLEIEGSEFAYSGRGDGWTHHLYAGRIALLKVSSSYFHHANQGHLLKSRAIRSVISYNRLSDESGGRASYELEFPNGGDAAVVGNIIQQGAGTSNSVIVSYGIEGYAPGLNALRMAHNTVVNDHPQGGTFLRVAPGATAVILRRNLLVGAGKIDVPDGLDSVGDQRVDWDYFTQAARLDYRPRKAATRADRPVAGTAAADDWSGPRFEYTHPMRLTALAAPAVHAGAVQTLGP
jgi:hypothetical protein